MKLKQGDTSRNHETRPLASHAFMRPAGTRLAVPADPSTYFTLTTRVAVEFEVSIPSKVTVPLGRNWKLAGGGGAVTPTVMVMLCTPMLFPKLAIVQTITLPPNPGAGALQLAAAGVAAKELIAKRGSIVMVNTTLLAGVFVPLETVQLRMPVSPGLMVLGLALPETGTEIDGSDDGGGGVTGWPVLKALLKVSEEPFASNAVTVDVSVIAAAFICVTTVIFSVCPGAMEGTLQMVWVTPLPTAEHVPESGTADMMKAPSMVDSTLFTVTLKIGNGDAFWTTTV